MAYELTIARLIVELGPLQSKAFVALFKGGAEAAAKASDEQRRLIAFSPRLQYSNAFVRGYLAFAAALGEANDGSRNSKTQEGAPIWPSHRLI